MRTIKNLGLVSVGGIAAMAASTMAAVASVAPLAAERMGGIGTPDRLSVEPDSPYFDPIYRKMGVKFNGVARESDVQEYCVSEGWLDVRVRDKRGRFVKNWSGIGFKTERLHGMVEPYRVGTTADPKYKLMPPRGSTIQHDGEAAFAAAEAKRARKAAKLARIAGNG